MNQAIQNIIQHLQETLEGDPWYGRPVYAILEEVHPAIVYDRPGKNDTSHSLIDLLYHMITWSEFTLKRLEKDQEKDSAYSDKLDWRNIDPTVHTWENGLKEFWLLNNAIIEILETKDDSLLEEKVDFREYNFGVLLNGLIEHHIYHLGQIAYVKKLLEGRE
ncbi:MAG: DinB family protein [Chitinophagaceae bacterium]